MADQEENKPDSAATDEGTPKTEPAAAPKKKAPVKKKAAKKKAAKKKSVSKTAAEKPAVAKSADPTAAKTSDADKAKQEAVQKKMQDMGLMPGEKSASSANKPAPKQKGSSFLVWASLAVAAALGLYLLLSGNGSEQDATEQAATTAEQGDASDSYLPPWASHEGRYRIPPPGMDSAAGGSGPGPMESAANQPQDQAASATSRPQPPEAPAWMRDRPQPPEAPAWMRDRPQPPEVPAWVRERPQPPEAPAWMRERPQPPEAPAWVQGPPPAPPGAAGWPEPPVYRAPPPYYSAPY